MSRSNRRGGENDRLERRNGNEGPVDDGAADDEINPGIDEALGINGKMSSSRPRIRRLPDGSSQNRARGRARPSGHRRGRPPGRGRGRINGHASRQVRDQTRVRPRGRARGSHNLAGSVRRAIAVLVGIQCTEQPCPGYVHTYEELYVHLWGYHQRHPFKCLFPGCPEGFFDW